MRTAFRLAAFVALAASLTGCRFKGIEGFVTATEPRVEARKEIDFGDSHKSADRADWGKGNNGGIADASGGTNATTRYGAGAKSAGTVLPGYDQPQKGSGGQSGEYPNVAAAGHAQTNAPSFQPSPSDVGR